MRLTLRRPCGSAWWSGVTGRSGMGDFWVMQANTVSGTCHCAADGLGPRHEDSSCDDGCLRVLDVVWTPWLCGCTARGGRVPHHPDGPYGGVTFNPATRQAWVGRHPTATGKPSGGGVVAPTNAEKDAALRRRALEAGEHVLQRTANINVNLLNRRIRTRTYGGVRGRGSNPAPYPERYSARVRHPPRQNSATARTIRTAQSAAAPSHTPHSPHG